MRQPVVRLAVTAFVLFPAVLGAQRSAIRDISREAEQATQHYRAGWELMRSESWDRAVYEFQESIRFDPKFALAYYSLGRAQMMLRRFPLAIDAYVKCRDLYLARVGEQFSNQMEANRFRDEQIMQYQEAIRQATATPTGGQRQTMSLYQRQLQDDLRRLEEARSRNTTVTFDNAVPFFVSMSLGAAYFRSNRFEDAEREYKAALDANPNSGETRNNLAVLYMLTGRLNEALREVELAEKTGFKVNPGLKDDLRARMGRQ